MEWGADADGAEDCCIIDDADNCCFTDGTDNCCFTDGAEDGCITNALPMVGVLPKRSTAISPPTRNKYRSKGAWFSEAAR